MQMFNPPHPGEFISKTYLASLNLSGRELAKHIGVSASALNRVLQGKSAISPEMALRLSQAIGRTPESWLAMQDQYDLWQAKKSIQLENIRPLFSTTMPMYA